MKDPFKHIPNRGKPIPGTKYKIGDPIGYWWVIYDLVGKGGMGIVYLVYNQCLKSFEALKSFREEYVVDPLAREIFAREVNLWINLETHPHIVEANWIEEFSGRFYVSMDYIQPIEGMKGSSLDVYLESGPIGEKQALKWAIQFCLGMEHVNKFGVKCHRDIKPGNILIDLNGNVRISDFGLAKAWDKTQVLRFTKDRITKSSVLSWPGKGGCGSPPYMPPEQFESLEGDTRNDIYSFGVVLYEMITGRLPYVVNPPDKLSPEALNWYWNEWARVHREEPLPNIGEGIGEVVKKCIAKNREERYFNFTKLRHILSKLYKRKTGLIVETPKIAEPGVPEYNRRSAQLSALGRHQEAIDYCDKALRIEPRNTVLWNNKGTKLAALGRRHEAIRCYDVVLEINPQDEVAWYNKGISLGQLGNYKEAVNCFDKALQINDRCAYVWINKGYFLDKIDHHEEALICFDRALQIDPTDSSAWNNKAVKLAQLGRRLEAISCYNKALEIEPWDDIAWYNQGINYYQIDRPNEALSCYDKALKINPGKANIWVDRGLALRTLGCRHEAWFSFQKAMSLDPQIKEKLKQMGII